MNVRRCKALKAEAARLVPQDDDELYWKTYRQLRRAWSKRNHDPNTHRPSRHERSELVLNAVSRGMDVRQEREKILRKHESLRSLSWMPIENLRRKARAL